MLSQIFIIMSLGVIAFFPIVIWAYTFSYIDDNPLNKKRFLVGVLGGALSVVPLLFFEKISSFFGWEYLNVFYYISRIQSLFSSFQFSFSLGVFVLFIAFFSLIFGFLVLWKKKNVVVYGKNILLFFLFVFLLGIIIFIANFLLGFVDFPLSEPNTFSGIVFGTFRLIIFYYLVVAFIEESSKHFNFLQSSSLSIKTIKGGVEEAIFIALGFSFIENILYLYNFYMVYGLSFELVKIYFFRSFFSIIVHVLCSSVVAYYFSKAFLLYKKKELSLPYIKIFFFGLGLSIVLHLFFDVALSLGFSIVLFLYFIGGYLYVSSIFYKENGYEIENPK